MFSGKILFISYSLASILVSSIIAYLFFKRRKSPGAFALFLLMLCTVEWASSTLLSTISTDLKVKIFWDNMNYPGVVLIPILWFTFCVQYTRQYVFLKKELYLLLSINPVITLIMVFNSNLRHFLSFNTRTEFIAGSSLSIVVYNFGIWFWIHVIYSFILIMLGMFILLWKLIRSPRVYRNQAIIIIVALLVPLIGEVLFLFGLTPIKNLDATTFCFSIAGLLLFIGMFRFKILDLIPIAREAIIENMDNPVIVLDSNSRIIDINNSAKIIFDGGQRDLIGDPISKILEDIPNICENPLELMPPKEFVINVDNKEKYYIIKFSALLDKNKNIVGSFIVFNDITDLKETMEKLDMAKIAAENANKAKSDFLATMTHELRTPINGIIGMAELLESASLTEQERENLSLLQYSADSLLGIINEILDFSKIEAGKMEIENIDFNIRELILNTVKTFNYNEKTKYIDFTCNIDDKIPQTVSGDPVRLRQILINLLSNSFKFTEKGSISVNVNTAGIYNNMTLLNFSVSDTGIGMPEDKIDKLFESFHQLDSSTTRKYGGTGLGLSIVKRLVELMGGSIKVESKVGAGSTFHFEIFFKLTENILSDNILSTNVNHTTGKQAKILVVEDSKVNRSIIIQFLKKRNLEADAVENGKKALERFEHNVYDLILMDIQMPELDGYETTKIIREIEQTVNKHTPIVALTANATEEDRKKCLECGMDDFISKPVKSEKLYSCIFKYLS